MKYARQQHSAEIAAECLGYIHSLVSTPQSIDAFVAEQEGWPRDVFTSILRNRAVIITPYYQAIQFENNLKARLQWSKIFGYPFAEASLRFSANNRLVNVVLRAATDVQDGVLESAHYYPIPELTTTTAGVVDAVVAHAEEGKCVVQRSGIVDVSDERLAGSNWGISRVGDPLDIVHGISAILSAQNVTRLR